MALINEISSFKTLSLSYRRARKQKRYRPSVLLFSYNLEKNLTNINKKISDGSYRHGSYYSFIVRDAKKRVINAAPFRDRVVHHAICHVVTPLFEPSFISDSYACRKDKGTHRAVKKMKGWVKRTDNTYCLKCDISKYFQSINQDILLGLMKKKIKEPAVIDLLTVVIRSYSSQRAGVGIPIGNLTSQIMANIYLNPIDQLIKRHLGCHFYMRYMDDFLILDKSKIKLWFILSEIKLLIDNLCLCLHPSKIRLFIAKTGVEWLGYVIYSNYILLRKSSVQRMLERKQQTISHWVSWLSYAQQANSWFLLERIKKMILQVI